jgi:hypothetical protein
MDEREEELDAGDGAVRIDISTVVVLALLALGLLVFDTISITENNTLEVKSMNDNHTSLILRSVYFIMCTVIAVRFGRNAFMAVVMLFVFAFNAESLFDLAGRLIELIANANPKQLIEFIEFESALFANANPKQLIEFIKFESILFAFTLFLLCVLAAILIYSYIVLSNIYF